MAIHSSILTWRTPVDRGAGRATVHGAASSDLTTSVGPPMGILLEVHVPSSRVSDHSVGSLSEL